MTVPTSHIVIQTTSAPPVRAYPSAGSAAMMANNDGNATTETSPKMYVASWRNRPNPLFSTRPSEP